MEEHELLGSALSDVLKSKSRVMRKSMHGQMFDDEDLPSSLNGQIRAALSNSFTKRISGFGKKSGSRAYSRKKGRRRSTIRLQNHSLDDLNSVIFIDLDAGSDIRIEDNDENVEQLLQQIKSLVSDRIGLKDMNQHSILSCGPHGALPSHLSRRLFRAFEVAYGWPGVFSAPDVTIESRCENNDDDGDVTYVVYPSLAHSTHLCHLHNNEDHSSNS
mgnify:CR=1 FL=1